MTTGPDTPRPYYVPVGDEEQVFAAAFRQHMSLVLKGPTGCGKTRFVEAMAHDLGRPLVTVSCHVSDVGPTTAASARANVVYARPWPKGYSGWTEAST